MADLITNLTTNVPAPVNYQLMTGLLLAARKVLPYFNGTKAGELRKNGGAYAVEWERIENLTAVTTPLAEPSGNATFGNGRDAVRPSVTRMNVAMAKYGNVINLTEEVDLVQVNARAMGFMDLLGANAGESLNLIMQDAVLAGTTTTGVRLAGGVATITAIATAISGNDIKYCVNQLNRNSATKMFPQGFGDRNIGTAPVRQSYFGICHPDVEEDIRAITGFIGVEQYAGYTNTEIGEFGALNGVRWCSTEIANITADAATATATGLRGTSTTQHDVYDCLIYGEDSIGSVGLGEEHTEEIYKMYTRVPAVELIYHKPGSSGAADPYNEVGSLSWKGFFAGKVLNANWVTRLRVAASKLS